MRNEIVQQQQHINFGDMKNLNECLGHVNGLSSQIHTQVADVVFSLHPFCPSECLTNQILSCLARYNRFPKYNI